jgi:hypothetical protein
MIINNRETAEGDKANYIDQDGQIHEATITNLTEENGNAFADLTYDRDGQLETATQVPHNTSPERHSWNHALV